MLEELEQARKELGLIMKGQMKANDACQMVNHWLLLSVYDLAYSVAHKPTKEDRASAMGEVKKAMPEFVDDVQIMAKKIFKIKKERQK